MRVGVNDAGFIYNRAGDIAGVSLGWSFAAQHEWGIADLVHSFRLPVNKELGYESRTNRSLSPGFALIARPSYQALLSLPYTSSATEEVAMVERHAAEFISRRQRLSEFESGAQVLDVYGAWCESAFVALTDVEHGPVLRDLYEAFHEHQGIITFGSSTSPLGNSSLHLINGMKLSAEERAEARSSHFDVLYDQAARY